jgi:hypothetical protein
VRGNRHALVAHTVAVGSRRTVISRHDSIVGDSGLLTEQEVVRSWRKLFKGGEWDESVFDRAELLLEELRPESPLRHRLGCELDELRKLRSVG